MDLRLCIWELRRRRCQSQCCCGERFVHIEVSAAAGPSSDFVSRAGEIRMFSAERAIKPAEKRVFEIAQIEVPG